MLAYITYFFFFFQVNHFPGSGYLTQKNNLAALPITHIPKSFLLPANKVAFLNYVSIGTFMVIFQVCLM